MASITTRVGKGSPLSTQELDANFTNLNADKLEKSGESATFADLTLESAAETLHRSPNAITAMFVYDTSKDSDGGAWTEKCQHTSWYNEDLCGKWLGAHDSEAAARTADAVLGEELITNGTFDSDTTGWTPANNPILSVTNGVVTLTNGANYSYIQQYFPTVVGKTYRYSVGVRGGGLVGVGLPNGTTVINNSGVASGTFVAIGTTTYFRIGNSTLGPGTTCYFDNISVKEVISTVDHTDDYFQLTTDGKFYKLNAGSGTTEVFRGNKRSFPKVAGIVAEAASVTIYDLTEPGSPMWMRFVGGANAVFASLALNWASTVAKNIATVASANGIVATGSNTTAGNATIFDFAKDKITTVSHYSPPISLVKQQIAYRNSGAGAINGGGDGYSIPNGTSGVIYAIAMTVLPDAPVDPVTGLKVPTIAVATAGGVSIIKHNGTVVNSSTTGSFTTVTITPYMLMVGRVNYHWYAANPGSLGASFSIAPVSGANAPDFVLSGNTVKLVNCNRNEYLRRSDVTYALVNLLKNNEGTIGKGVAAKITDTYNAGHLLGDIRRAYLANSATADRSYKSATATANGTITSAAVNTDTDLVAYSGFSGSNYLQEPYSADLDFGTGEWSVGAWVNYSIVAPHNLFGYDGTPETLATVSEGSTLPLIIPSSYLTIGGVSLTRVTDSAGGETAYRITTLGYTVNTNRVNPNAGKWYVLAGGLSSSSGGITRTVSFKAKAFSTNATFVAWAGYGNSTHGMSSVSVDLTSFGTTVAASVDRTIQDAGNGWSLVTLTFKGGMSGNSGFIFALDLSAFAVGDGIDFCFARQALGTVSFDVSTAGVASRTLVAGIADRSYSSGPYILLDEDYFGRLTATAYDGTTTRTVTTSAAYNTATWLKAEAEYTTDGALAIRVNGQKVATTTGTPLLSLSGRYNLLTWTEAFDNAVWSKPSGVLSTTSNMTISPYGDNTADLIYPALTSSWGFTYQSSGLTANTVYTQSVYAKSAGKSWIWLGFDNSATKVAWFDIANGVVGTVGASISSSNITNVGNGWYRCSVTYSHTAAPLPDLGISDADNAGTVTANGTDGVYVWGAQVEIGSTASAYQRVTTVAETNVPPLTIGNSYALDAPFPGSLALLKLSATVPTTEQASWMYEQEKQLFRDGAKCVLPASTSVLDLTYDDVTDTWSALQASYESTWSGLVRTSTQAPSAGSFSKVSAGSGIKLLGRTTTNPGVDVQLPAKNLRTKDMPPDSNQDIVVFDFDAVASQTDFALPVGYTARVVYSAGAQKREGSIKDWTRLFDGFVETIRFAVAPGNAVWVQIHATKEVA